MGGRGGGSQVDYRYRQRPRREEQPTLEYNQIGVYKVYTCKYAHTAGTNTALLALLNVRTFQVHVQTQGLLLLPLRWR